MSVLSLLTRHAAATGLGSAASGLLIGTSCHTIHCTGCIPQAPTSLQGAGTSAAADTTHHLHHLRSQQSPGIQGTARPLCSSWSSPCAAPWHMVQHLRCVHSYSRATGTPKPAPWPLLEPVPVSQSKQQQQQQQQQQDVTQLFKWSRTVLRPPPEVQVVRHDNQLLLTGRAGSVKVDLTQLDPTGLVAFKLLQVPMTEAPTADGGSVSEGAGDSSTQQRYCILVSSPHKERFQAVVDALESNIQGVMQGYMVALTVKGVGYRLEPVDYPVQSRRYFFEQPSKQDGAASITYPHNKPVRAVRLRVGYSRPVVYPLPASVRAFCVKPTLMYLYGLQQDKLNQLAQSIRAVRKPNVYTGNGIQIVGEVLRQKQRSSRKGK